mgnify:CR=1 FL=1
MDQISIHHLPDFSELEGFHSGISEIDSFIVTGLKACIDSHLCIPYGCYDSNGNIIAFFALSFDSLDLDSEDKYDLRNGYSFASPPFLPPNYEIFWEKTRYPALEITYFAVRKEWQRQGIGTSILKAIVKMARNQNIAGCQFITVNALHLNYYSAIGFYRSFGFSRYGNIAVPNDIVPMYFTLYS